MLVETMYLAKMSMVAGNGDIDKKYTLVQEPEMIYK